MLRRHFDLAVLKMSRDKNLQGQGLLPTIRHFENRRGEGPGDEVEIVLEELSICVKEFVSLEGALSRYLAIEFQNSLSSFVIKGYLKILKLFSVGCRYGWHGWKWIET